MSFSARHMAWPLAWALRFTQVEFMHSRIDRLSLHDYLPMWVKYPERKLWNTCVVETKRNINHPNGNCLFLLNLCSLLKAWLPHFMFPGEHADLWAEPALGCRCHRSSSSGLEKWKTRKGNEKQRTIRVRVTGGQNHSDSSHIVPVFQ